MATIRENKKNGKLPDTAYHSHRGIRIPLSLQDGYKRPYLSNSEVKWLRNRNGNHRLAVRELAREVYAEISPYAARNQRKQQLSIKVLELAVDTEVYNL